MRNHLPAALVLLALAAWTRHPTERPDVQGPGSGEADAAAAAAEDGGAGDAGGAGGRKTGGPARASQPCADHQDCYPEGFRASGETRTTVQPTTGTTCVRASRASPPDADGPVIFDIGQDVIGTNGELCRRDRSCLNDGNVCQFSFQAYDPEGDLAADDDDAYLALRFIRDDGTESDAFAVRAAGDSRYFVQGCWAQTLTTFTGAVLMHDLSGHRSNALCFEGSAL